MASFASKQKHLILDTFVLRHGLMVLELSPGNIIAMGLNQQELALGNA